MPATVLLKLNTVDYDTDCGGDNMIKCREAIIDAIAKAAKIPRNQVTDLKLQPGLNLPHIENMFDVLLFDSFTRFFKHSFVSFSFIGCEVVAQIIL